MNTSDPPENQINMPSLDRLICIAVATLVLAIGTAKAGVLFEYSGRVRSVGGTVTDGSLLPFVVGDIINGVFFFSPQGPDTRPSPNEAFYPNAVPEMRFGQIEAVGNQVSYSYFLVNAATGRINAYRQVGNDAVYDNFSFLIGAGSGLSPFSSQTPDFSKLNLDDFSGQADFSLQRVDISTQNPLLFTEVVVDLQSLTVSAVPEPESLYIFGIAALGLIVCGRRKRSPLCLSIR
ncbi:hypothetical protein NZK35_23120 [Stieleria sp. ICT_E10.1]|uniref:hypothetical protein n=1 Tax=Stieleria sedimenti TaxID=2976331 RepID=UPI0021806032|nr:hypothetical protein [Stieleria sedimenti]MCS7469554.1 hypothetical protein [Stieleria sedimenti]